MTKQLNFLHTSLLTFLTIILSSSVARAQSATSDDTKIALATKMMNIMTACNADGGVNSLKGRAKSGSTEGLHECSIDMKADSSWVIIAGGETTVATVFYFYEVGTQRTTDVSESFVTLRDILVSEKKWTFKQEKEGETTSYTLSDDIGMPRMVLSVDGNKNTLTVLFMVICQK
jgi:hypothetical protein